MMTGSGCIEHPLHGRNVNKSDLDAKSFKRSYTQLASSNP